MIPDHELERVAKLAFETARDDACGQYGLDPANLAWDAQPDEARHSWRKVVKVVADELAKIRAG